MMVRKILAGLSIALLLAAPVAVQAQSNPFPFNSGPTVLQNAAVANGNGNVMSVGKLASLTLQVTGTLTSLTVNFETSNDGTNYVALPCLPINSATSVTTTTATGMFRCNVAGLNAVRARVSSYSSGTVTVTAYGSSAANSTAGSGGTGSGAGGSATVYTQTLNPTAMSALVGNLVTASAEQTFTVTGLTTSNRVFVNGPAPTANCPPAGVRVSGANTLSINFIQLTSAVCTPATGTYNIVAF